MNVATAAPPRTDDQRLVALERANDVRSKRSRLKRDLKLGAKSPINLLLDPPEWALTMRAYDALMALPKFGRVKVNRLFRQSHISPSKTIGGLSERQRYELIAQLRKRSR